MKKEAQVIHEVINKLSVAQTELYKFKRGDELSREEITEVGIKANEFLRQAMEIILQRRDELESE
jgi:hypothetical protein